jgi:hypothetical protein
MVMSFHNRVHQVDPKVADVNRVTLVSGNGCMLTLGTSG